MAVLSIAMVYFRGPITKMHASPNWHHSINSCLDLRLYQLSVFHTLTTTMRLAVAKQIRSLVVSRSGNEKMSWKVPLLAPSASDNDVGTTTAFLAKVFFSTLALYLLQSAFINRAF